MKKILLAFCIILLSNLSFGQFVTVSNVTRTGNFNCGAAPTITAQIIAGDGVSVVNGNLVVNDPCGFTTLRITMTNLRYNQPSANWPHGFYFPEGENVTVSNVNLPAGWILQNSCTGASCSAQDTGGLGFYYDGSAGSSCSECWPTINDGIPSNNYGQSSMNCSTPFTIAYDMTFCNSKIESETLTFTFKGSSDGNTGCWSSPDVQNNQITYTITTTASETPLFIDLPSNTENITECFDGGATLNYIAVLEATCGSGDGVTWWDAPEGGNLIGTGSPFYYDPPGNQCPAGMLVYSSCCPDGEGCERRPVVIGHCMPPSDEPIFEDIPAQCPGLESPLPAVSLNGATGNWTPAFDPFNTATYTFIPDEGQCVTELGSMTVEILPQIDLTFNPVDEICQGGDAPDLPDPNETGITGVWSPAIIDTTEPGTFVYTFIPDDACSADATIEVTIVEKAIAEFEMTTEYCQGEEAQLPEISNNGLNGTWSPAIIDTSAPGVNTYTFTPSGTNCFEVFEIEIEVVEFITPSFLPVDAICQNTTPIALPDPVEVGVTGTWSPAIIDTTQAGVFEYTFTADAACTEPVVIEIEILPEIIPDFVMVNEYCQFEDAAELPTISDNGFEGSWSPAVIDTNTPGIHTYTFTPAITSCSEPFVFQVEVIEQIIPTFMPMAEICQNSVAPELPQPIEAGLTGTWSPATIDTTQFGTFQYTFTADYACTEPVVIEVVILEELIPNFVLDNTYCQFEAPQDLNLISDNGIPGSWFPASIDTDTPGTTTYTFTPDVPDCSVTFSFNVTVNPQPVLNQVPNQTLCDQDFDGVYETNLTAFNGTLGGGAGVNYTYYASLNDYNNGNPIPNGQLNNYHLTNLPATIYVTGTSVAGCRSESVTILFEEGDSVQHNPGPFGPIKYCPEDTVDLTVLENNISTAVGVQFGYYNTLGNAQNDAGEILNPTNFIPANGQTSVFVRLDANGKCSAIVEIKLEKLPTPGLELDQVHAIVCEGEPYEVTASSDLNNVTFEWTLEDGTQLYGATQVFNQSGVYSVTAYSADGCRSQTQSITIVTPTAPTIVSMDLGSNSITVGAVNGGEGPMEYSLDGVFWQNSNVFNNLIAGESYTVWVRSKGCMVAKYVVTLLKLPNFFSPNDDGINDTWQIRGIEVTPNATLKIFDRYGKIFVDTNFEGYYEWNGKYMGRNLPSDDYWYIIHVPSDGVVAERRYVGHISIRSK